MEIKLFCFMVTQIVSNDKLTKKLLLMGLGFLDDFSNQTTAHPFCDKNSTSGQLWIKTEAVAAGSHLNW